MEPIKTPKRVNYKIVEKYILWLLSQIERLGRLKTFGGKFNLLDGIFISMKRLEIVFNVLEPKQD